MDVGLVLLTVDKMQSDRVFVCAADQRLLGDRDLGRSRIADVGLKNISPGGPASRGRAYVLDVNHRVLKLFIKHPRLDLYGSQRARQIILQTGQRGSRSWRHEDTVAQGQQPGGNSKKRNDPYEPLDSHPGGPHRSDLTIRRHAAQPNQYTDQ